MTTSLTFTSKKTRSVLVMVVLAMLLSFASVIYASDPVDTDSDGVEDALDNCPTVANPDQANSWGGDAGDACESPRYDAKDYLVAAFAQADGVALWGYCVDKVCSEFGLIDPLKLTPTSTLRTGDASNSGYYSLTSFLYEDEHGADVYQVKFYINGTLIDNDLKILRHSDGSWSMQARGGDTMYIGNIPAKE